MKTFLAPAEMASKEELAIDIDVAANSPVLDGLLHSVGGLLAVLNKHRQIVCLNQSFIATIGITNPEEVFGLRPGKVVKCIHADEEPAGCGTTEYCSTCGAAIAIVTSIEKNQPAERVCALSFRNGETTQEKAFLVKSHPIKIEERRFLLLFLQDITVQEQRAALERTFFHDINNLIYILTANSELLVEERPSKFAQAIHEASLRIQKEVSIQRCLFDGDSFQYNPVWFHLTTDQILMELESFFTHHPVAREKKIRYKNTCPESSVKTDLSLVQRVLSNMIMNALEASSYNEKIEVISELEGDNLNFKIWNAQSIPKNVRKRIFSRNYSTKNGDGRGVGTYSMKLFGEKYLGGKVSFVSSEENGTTFKLALPF